MVSMASPPCSLFPGFLYHVPWKRFHIPEIFGIGLPLVETTEILQETSRVSPRTPEFPDDGVPFHSRDFPFFSRYS